MDISQRGRAVALSFLSPLPELRRWSRDFLLLAPVSFVSLVPPLLLSFPPLSSYVFLFRPLPISRLTDGLNRAGGPPYFYLAGRVHSPRHCSDCDQTETSWALLLAERTIYRIQLAREHGKSCKTPGLSAIRSTVRYRFSLTSHRRPGNVSNRVQIPSPLPVPPIDPPICLRIGSDRDSE